MQVSLARYSFGEHFGKIALTFKIKIKFKTKNCRFYGICMKCEVSFLTKVVVLIVLLLRNNFIEIKHQFFIINSI